MGVTIFLLTTLLLCLGIFINYLRNKLHYWQTEGIPHEQPHWLMGSFRGLQTTRSFNQIWQDYYDKFRDCNCPFAGFYWFFKPSVFLLDPALIKNVLIRDFSHFTDRGLYHNEKDDPLTGQLFLLDGLKWRNMRNKLSPTFTSGKMKFMFPTVVQVGEKFIEVFNKVLQKEGEIVEVKELLARFTIDVIGTCAFGIECNSLDDPNTDFRIIGQKALQPNRHNRLILAFMASFVSLAQKLRMKSTEDDVEQFYLGIVRKTVEYREKNNIRRNDFMDMLIDLKNQKLIKSQHGDELTNLTIEQIAAQAFVFFTAGFETSSTTMGFALYELAQYPEVQDKARQEIAAIMQRHNQQLSYECMKEMQYLEQIILETLRLHTVVPVLNRLALKDYPVPGNPKFVIRKGMIVLIPAEGIHLDERYYSNPNEFNPEHFTPEKIAERDSVLHLPFGEGPRNCIGLRFGKMQACIGLALLLNNYRFSVCERTEIPLKLSKKGFLTSTESGIYLKVEKL